MSDFKGSISATIMLFIFIAIFGHNLITNGNQENTMVSIAWLIIVFVSLTFAIVDWNKRHPELDEVDDA
jgi:hypothetical protein